jgi:lysophospholipase L1-like esterase
MKIPKKYRIISLNIIGLITIIEILLRLIFGLGNPVLSQADSETGYRFQPNQKIFRFGKHIEYNQYSQRSEPITPEKSTQKLRILMIGDSVLNGGNPTDQHQTITEFLETKLTQSGHPAEILNASAGSWGIGNEFAYLRKFGIFQSDALILQIGTHDLTQPKSTSERVGYDPNYPDQLPLSAIQEGLIRYLFPSILQSLKLKLNSQEIPVVLPQAQYKQFQENLETLKKILTWAKQQNIPVFVLFTPNREDLVPHYRIPPYKSEFLQLLNSNKVTVIDTHQVWSEFSLKTVDNYFRDEVHLSVAGNQAVANLLFQQLCESRKLSACSIHKRF